MGARVYSPKLARFTQVDRIDGGSCNAYSFTCGNPIVDPDLTGDSIASWVGDHIIEPLCKRITPLKDSTCEKSGKALQDGFAKVSDFLGKASVAAGVLSAGLAIASVVPA